MELCLSGGYFDMAASVHIWQPSWPFQVLLAWEPSWKSVCSWSSGIPLGWPLSWWPSFMNLVTLVHFLAILPIWSDRTKDKDVEKLYFGQKLVDIG
jgi:hypothetical protein